MGSAITYARRYSLSALVGVVADDDDDGEGAWRRDADREPPRRNTPEPPAPQSKPERVNLAALAKALSEVRDSAGSSPVTTAIGLLRNTRTTRRIKKHVRQEAPGNRGQGRSRSRNPPEFDAAGRRDRRL